MLGLDLPCWTLRNCICVCFFVVAYSSTLVELAVVPVVSCLIHLRCPYCVCTVLLTLSSLSPVCITVYHHPCASSDMLVDLCILPLILLIRASAIELASCLSSYQHILTISMYTVSSNSIFHHAETSCSNHHITFVVFTHGLSSMTSVTCPPDSPNTPRTYYMFPAHSHSHSIQVYTSSGSLPR